MGVVFIAQQVCAFVFEGHDAFDVVGIIPFVFPSAVGEGAPHFFAQGAVVGILHERDVAWVIEGEAVFAFLSVLFCIEGGGFECAVGEAGKVCFVLDDHLKGLGGFGGVVHE